MTSPFHSEVLELYSEVDREVAEAGPVCETSGRCCRFKEHGHVLYLSNLEAEVLIAGAPAFGKPVSEGSCPFQMDDLCTARTSRPLGCRIYFCDPAYQETGNQLTEKYLHRMKELAARYRWDWLYAPLHHFLNLAAGTSTPISLMTHSETKSRNRVELPLVSGGI